MCAPVPRRWARGLKCDNSQSQAPHVFCRMRLSFRGSGGFLERWAGSINTHIYMAPFSVSANNGSTNPRTLIHELGHLAMGLEDEYMGVNLIGNFCTDARHSGPAGDFSAFGIRAACIMDSQFQSSKYCSSHKDSAHRAGTWQPGPCWGTVHDSYGDPGPGGRLARGSSSKTAG
jgi:hypothetical protein